MPDIMLSILYLRNQPGSYLLFSFLRCQLLNLRPL